MILKIVNQDGSVEYTKVKDIVIKEKFIESYTKGVLPDYIYFKDVTSIDLYFYDNVDFIYPK